MAKPIYVLNGPNLNLLGAREPEVYGRETLDDLRARCERKAAALGFSLEFRQSNHEGELVAWIQEARTKAAGLIVNAGAFTHTSIAMLDALLACPVPAVEVHLSNIFTREPFRAPFLYLQGREGCDLRLRGDRLRAGDRGAGRRDRYGQVEVMAEGRGRHA